MQHIATILLMATALALPSQSGLQAGAEDAVLRLDELVAEALSANPEIASLHERLSAFERRVQPAGALPDPVVGITLNNFSLQDLFNTPPLMLEIRFIPLEQAAVVLAVMVGVSVAASWVAVRQ